MKYLYKFNENNEDKNSSSSLEEIKNLCNSNLAYLMDEGFKLDFLIRKNRIGDKVHKTVRILLNKDGGTSYNPNLFKWNDIKDDFIPSIIMLSEKYKLLTLSKNKDICINFLEKKDKYFSIEDILEDNIPDSSILNIKFHVLL